MFFLNNETLRLRFKNYNALKGGKRTLVCEKNTPKLRKVLTVLRNFDIFYFSV